METTKTTIKSRVVVNFLSEFSTQSLFLATLLDPKEGKFDQETLKNGLKILINTLAAVRRFEPAFAQDEEFIKLGMAIRKLDDVLSPESYTVLRRASNLAKLIVKKVENQVATPN